MILTKNNQQEIIKWLEKASDEGAFLLMDKDKDWTSFDVVAKVRNLTRIKKVGHAGTLDPLATGLLILALGKATKEIDNFRDLSKSYIAEIKLGATTKTYDSEAEEENIIEIIDITSEKIVEIMNGLQGVQKQVPPIYSAKKHKGKKLYQLARKNIKFEPEPVEIEIYSINILKINLPYIRIEVVCSKGTYIRSLAYDIGQKLECGAYLYELRRTEIGEYNVRDAFKISDFENIIKKNSQLESKDECI